MIDTEIKIQDIWLATVYTYAGSELVRVTLLDEKVTEWTFLVESEDARILQEDYFSTQGLAVSNVRAFVNAFNRLAQQQRELRRTGVALWEAPRSENWWLLAKSKGDAIIAAREAIESKR